MLKDKIDWNREEKIPFYWIPGHCGAEVNERADPEAKQSINEAEIVNYYYQWQSLYPSGKRKAKKNFTVSVKTPNGIKGKANLKGTTGMARLRGSAR
jgi:hypothetical protein